METRIRSPATGKAGWRPNTNTLSPTHSSHVMKYPWIRPENINHIYFMDNGGDIVLKGPENPGSDILVWEFEPHSGRVKQTVVTLRPANSGAWNMQMKKGVSDTEVHVGDRTVDLAIKKPTFKWSGLFTLNQKKPRNQILKLYEIYGIKGEASPQRPLLGSDVTLSCTISRLSDTVSLHWRPKDSSQQNRSNTEQIRLNNKVYLMVRHVTVEDGKLYVCEVQENGKIVHTSNGDFTVNKTLYKQRYTVYRSSTDHSELHLVCYNTHGDSSTVMAWTSRRLQRYNVIATATASQPINVEGADFGNRLVTSAKPFDGKDFSVRIVPVLFQDAGRYSCFLGNEASVNNEGSRSPFLTVDLITVKGRRQNAASVFTDELIL
ncbi:uncharacterized protein LOC144599776 [Rhinoraja longicauda]